MKKKVLAWVLSVFMAVTMMPLPAFATETSVDSSTQTNTQATEEPKVNPIAEGTTIEVSTLAELKDNLSAGNALTVVGDITIDEAITIPEGVTITVSEGKKLRVLDTLTNNGTINGKVIVGTMVYTVEEKTEYDVTATKNGAIAGTAPAVVKYEISLDGGESWITDTTNGKAQAVTVKTDGTVVVSASFQSAFTSAKTGEVVHMLKDAHVQSTNSKKNNGPLRSYYGLILEGNGHTIFTDLESSGASNEYATIKFTSYLAGTGPEVNPVLKNVTIDSQNNAKADLDYVSGDVTFTVTMYNVNLLGNCQYASFASKSKSMIINKSNVEIYDCTIPSWDAGSANAIDIYSGDYSLSLNSKCTVYGGTYTKDPSNYLAEGVILENADGKYVVKADPAYGKVAQVGEAYYETLADAIDAANAIEGGATVELLDDVTLGEKLTISGDVTILGDKKITRADDYTKTLFEVKAGAKLTLDGGLVVDGNNNWTLNTELYNKALNREVTGVTWEQLITSEEGKPNATAAMFVVNGSVDAKNVTIQNNYSTKDSNGGDGGVFKVIGADASLTMTGATVKHVVTGGANSVAYLSSAVWTINEGTLITDTFAARNGGICRNDSGKLVMNGGTIEKNNSINTNGTVVMLYKGSMEMNGGKICSNTGVSGTNNGRCAPIYGHSTSTFVMNDGEICHNTGISYGGVDVPSSIKVEINGGYVGDNISTLGNTNADINGNDNTVITGGTFTQDVSAWAADGFKVEYDEATGTYGVQEREAAKIGEVTYNSLQKAINVAKNGDVIVMLEDCDKNVTVAQAPDVNITIDGNGNTMTGTITVDGKSAAYATAGLTIQNINFKAADDSVCINLGVSGNNNTRYTSNVTVDNCTFTGNDKTAAAIKNYTGGCKKLTVTECSATGMHSLVQVKGVAGVQVDKCTIEDSKNGISVGTSTGVEITNSKINVGGYGVRADGSGAYTMNVEDCEITADQPIVVRKATGAYELTVGDGTFNAANDEGYDVILTNGSDDEALVVPTGNFTLNIADSVNAFPVDAYVATVGEKSFVSLKEALEACTNGETVKLIKDITYDQNDIHDAVGGATGFGEYPNPSIIDIGGTAGATAAENQPSNVNAVLDLNGHTITNNAEAYLFLVMDNAKLTFKDSVGTGKVVTVSNDYPAIWVAGTETTVTVESGAYESKAESLIWATHGGDLVITGGEFSRTGDADAPYLIMRNEHNRQNSNYFISGKATVTVTGGTFVGFNPMNMYDDSTTPAKQVNSTAEGYAATEIEPGVYGVVNYVKHVKEELLAGNSVTLEHDIVITDYDLVNALILPSNGDGKYGVESGNGAIFHVTKPGVVLDLNGHSITWDAHDAAYCNARQVSLFLVTGTGVEGETADLTIKDSVGTAKIDVYGMGTGVYVLTSAAKATVEGGTWTNYPCKTCGATNIFMYPSHGGKLEITGGTFEQKVDNPYLVAWFGSTKETTNNGVGIDYDETEVIISGGTFVGMNPGEEVKFFDNAASGAETTVNGCAEGYVPEDNGDGTYGVVCGLEGEGTEANPFLIKTVDDLKFFRDSVNAGETVFNADGVYVRLEDNIDLEGVDWSNNIGDDCNYTFDGIFDGNNKTIKNLTIKETAQKSDGYICTGLFGAIGGNAVVKDFTIKHVTIDTGDFTGNNVAAVVGFAYNATGSVEDVTVKGDIIINTANVDGVGTIVGYAYGGKLTIENCVVEGNSDSVVDGQAYVGGIIGYAGGKTTIEGCTVEDLTVNANSCCAAGIAGILLNGGVATGNTVEEATMTAAHENWQNSAAIVAGAITTGSVTVAGTTYDDVNTNLVVGCVHENKPTTPVKKVAACVNDVYYTDFAPAYAAANDGDTITLFRAVEVAAGETLTLDKAVTIEYTSDKPGEDMFTNKGTMVVDGATLVYVNTDTTANNVTVSTISTEPGSVLEVKGGVVKNDSENNVAKGIYAYAIDILTNGNLGDVTATISGGEVISTNYMAIRQFVNGEVCKNTLTVTNGTIIGGTRGINIQLKNNMAYTTISGGTIEGGAYSLCALTTSENLSVTGGTFVGPVWYSGTTGFIKGGTYDTELDTAYCVEGYEPYDNGDGTYTVTENPVYGKVAQVGSEYFPTLAAAIAAANAGDTITLLANITEDVTVSKNITIDGADFNYTGKMTLNKVNVTIENVNFVKGSVYKNKNTGVGGNFTIKNCTFDGQGLNDYAVNLGGTSKIVIENCTAKDYGYGFVQVPASNTSLSVKNVEVSDVNYGFKVDYSNGVTIENVNVDAAVAGVLNSNYGKKTITIKDSNINIYGTWTRNDTTKTDIVFEGANTIGEFIADANIDVFKLAADSTLTAPEEVTVITDVENSEVEYVSGTYYVVPKVRVAQIGDVQYKTLAAAIVAAEAGAEIELIADVTEDVTISKNITIDGAGKAYTGKMTVSNGKTVTVENVNFVKGYIDEGKGTSGALTVKNCNFDGVDDSINYAITMRGGSKVDIQGGTVKNYGYGLLYVPSAVSNVNVTGTTVENVNYGVHVAYGSKINLENVTMTNVKYGIMTQNYGAKTITVKDCQLTGSNAIYVWERNTTVVDTFNFEGENTVSALPTSAQAKLQLVAADATLTAPEGSNVTTTVDKSEVVYEDGAYKVKAKEAVAKIGDVDYYSLQAAIDAAQNDDVVTLAKDIDVTTLELEKLDGSYDTYFKVEGKTITVDLAGYEITGEYAGTGMLVGVFSTENNGNLTLTGNGTVDIKATGKVYSLIANYEAGCTITIENGTYKLDKASDSLLYTGGDEGIVVNGGDFTLGNVGAGDNGKPWIFNVYGSNDGNAIVSGGTFNADVNHQFWADEVYVAEDNALKNNGNGTWTVVPAVAYAVEKGKSTGSTERNVGYATLAEALAADTEKVVVTTDTVKEANVIVPAGVTLDLNGKTVEAGNLLSFGDVIDSKDGVGGVKISNNTTKAFFNLQASNGAGMGNVEANMFIPLYDSQNGCYRLYEGQFKMIGVGGKASNATKVVYHVAYTFENDAAYTLIANNEDTGMSIQVGIEWTGREGNPIFSNITSASIKKHAENMLLHDGKNYSITFTVSGLGMLNEGDTVTLKAPSLKTYSGATSIGADKVYTVPAK